MARNRKTWEKNTLLVVILNSAQVTDHQYFQRRDNRSNKKRIVGRQAVRQSEFIRTFSQISEDNKRDRQKGHL